MPGIWPRLLHLGEIVEGEIPSVEQESARDLFRGCEDCRRDLMAADSPFTAVVTRLGCLRGVSTLTAFGLATEIGDWHRLTGRTGNTHARRLLIEAAWHHRPSYRPGEVMFRRWDAATPAARDRGQAANRGLHTRWLRFDERKKHAVVANEAIARELAGWCWSLAVMDA